MPWMTRLDAQGRQAYADRRRHDIEVDRARIVQIIRSYPACSDLPDDLVDHLALRFATTATDAYDNGIQVGIDLVEGITQAQRQREHTFHMNVQVAVVH